MIYEYLVIFGYFSLIVGIGFAFKKMANRSTSDYFRGGGKMLWVSLQALSSTQISTPLSL